MLKADSIIKGWSSPNGRAIRLNPNSFFVHARCGMAFVYICEQERALASFDAALRLSPIDPE